MRIFGGERIGSMMSRLKVPEDVPIEAGMVSKAIETAQKKVEGHNFDIRKHLLEYDDVLNKHREAIYRRRREILELAEGVLEVTSEGYRALRDVILTMVDEEVRGVIETHAGADGWETDAIVEALSKIIPLAPVTVDELKKIAAEHGAEDAVNRAVAVCTDAARRTYDAMEQAVDNPDIMRELEKMLLIRTIDTLWVDHLVAIDHLRGGIGLRGYAQRDPLVEYKKETYYMYQELLGAIQHDVANTIFKMGAAAVMAPSLLEKQGIQMRGAVKGENGDGGAQKSAEPMPKTGRNEPCPCGSGKKYKKCHAA